MKRLLLAMALAAVCPSAPTPPNRIWTTNGSAPASTSLAADPKLGNLAPAERALAEQAVQALNDSSGGKAEHAHRLYVAERRVDIAYAAAQAVDTENRVAQLDREHDRILIEASRRELENARMEAEKQRIASMVQAEESDRLRAEGEQSAAAAESARAQSANKRKRIADAQAKEAELARKEAQLAELAASDLRGRLQNMRATRGAQGMQMTLDDIAFAPGRAALRPEAKSSLGKLVAFVNKDPSKPIRIEGHTDGRGNANANQLLSQKRADSVRDALIAAGVAANRMTSVGLGEDNPVADNETEEGRAKNRRVDVILEDAPR